MSNEKEIAGQLTAFLLEPERGRYGVSAQSPLAQYVETEIKAIAKKLAAEVIAAHPGLAAAVRQRTEQVVNAALRDDALLNRTVTEAVAKAITTVALYA